MQSVTQDIVQLLSYKKWQSAPPYTHLYIYLLMNQHSPHPSSSDPSPQSLSPSQTWLKRTHSVPSRHSWEPMRHFRTFVWAARVRSLGQLTSSEPSWQWERPSQTRLLETQLLRSLQRKSASKGKKKFKLERLVNYTSNSHNRYEIVALVQTTSCVMSTIENSILKNQV